MNAGAEMADLPARPLRLLCVNVNGLQDSPAKRRQLFGALDAGPWDVIQLQEAHAASVEEVEGWVREGAGRGLPFLGVCFANPLTSSSAGTVTLVKSSAPVSDPLLAAAPAGGRLLAASLSYAGLTFSLLNIYAPNDETDRPSFFSRDLLGALPAEGFVLAGGDFNCVEDAADVFGAAPGTRRFVGSAELQAVMQQRGMVDAWRCLNPQGRLCTHQATNGSGARLDRWYVSAGLLPWVTSAGAVLGLPGDHHGVEIQLLPPSTAAAGLPSGPGRFRLPLHHLSDPAFVEQASQCIQRYLQDHPEQPGGARQRWEGLKAELTYHCAAACAARRRRDAAARRALEARLHLAMREFCAHPELQVAQERYREAQLQLRDHQAAAAALQAQQTDVMWHCFGERPTKWFHRAARPAELPHLLTAVKDPADPFAPPADMATPEGRVEAMRRAVAFFSADSEVGLFRPAPCDADARRRLLEALDATLSQEEAAATLGPEGGFVTDAEVRGVFPVLPAGVAPGLDGLPYELYRVLWRDLGPPFLAMAREALLAGEEAGDAVMEAGEQAMLPAQTLAGLITLLRKPGGTDADASDLGSLRPITLLNCDYRILARVVAARMARALLSVIDSTQTAFLPGRDIADNIMYHLEALDWLEESGQPACTVHLDFRRAYDVMLRLWIFEVMRAMGFPRRAVLWVQVLLAGTCAQVSLNGHYTDAFPVRRGVQQGSPLSVLLYVIAAQPLAAALRRAHAQGSFHTYTLPDGSSAPPCHQHADDTSLHMRTPQDAAAALQGPVQDFCDAANAQVHMGKTKGLLFGDQSSLREDRVCSVCHAYFPPAQEPIKHLGIHLGTDVEAAQRRTWGARRARVAQGAAVYRSANLSWLGRCYVAKQVLAAMLVHHATFQPPPRDVWQRIQTALYAFMGAASLADAQTSQSISHPARHIAALPWEQGGIAMIDPTLHAECLQGKVAARLLSPGRHPWKALAAARLLRVAPALGAAAPLSGLQVSRLPLGPRRLAYMQGLQRLQPHRLVPPDQLSTNQVLIERLFYNRQVTSPDGQVWDPDSPLWQPLAAAGLLTVRQLRDAWLEQRSLALEIAWGCLPPAWRQAALQQPQSPWELHREHGQEIVRHQPDVGPPVYFEVRGDGGLRRVPAPPGLPADAAWQQCCVVDCLLGSGRARQARRVLLGAWTEVLVDPTVWGYGQHRLTEYRVRTATQRRVQLRAADRSPHFYSVGVGCRPALWPLPAAVPGPAAAADGLQALEARWASSHELALHARAVNRRRTAEFVVELLPCQQPGKRPRLGVHERLQRRAQQEEERRQQGGDQQQGEAQGGQAAPAAAAAAPRGLLQDDTVDAAAPAAATEEARAEHRAIRAAWSRLRQAGLPREQYGLVFRIMHGSLYVNAFLCHIHVLPAAAAYCECAECRPAERLETLSHAFVLCPAVAPAAEWLCAVFAAVAGGNAPPCAHRVLLGDEHAVWRPGPSLQHCWTHLRASFLHAVWQLRARRSRAGSPFCAADVCAETVAAVRAAIQRDWMRATRDLQRLPGVHSEWCRGHDVGIPLTEFEHRWAHRGSLCEVEPAANGEPPHMRLRFSMAVPVPAPAAALGAPAAGGAALGVGEP